MFKPKGMEKNRFLRSMFRAWNRPYVLKINSSDNNEEVLHIDLTKKGVYFLISMALVISFLLISLLFLFTPIKYYIPGFESNAMRKKILTLSKEVELLTEKQKNAEIYLRDIQMVAGYKEMSLDSLLLKDEEITLAEKRNAGIIDNESNYAALIQKSRGELQKLKDSNAKKSSDNSLLKKDVKDNLNMDNKVPQIEKPKKKDTIIIRN